MKTYLILLRGVMPTGKNKVPMAQLRETLTEAGFDNVRTYIQSGNVLADTELRAREVESRVHELIQKAYRARSSGIGPYKYGHTKGAVR